MEEKKRIVFAVKNYEDEDEDDYDEEHKGPMAIGTSAATRTEKRREDEAYEDKMKYIAEMDLHAKSIPRNYIDCKWFEKLNKVSFLILMD